MPSAPLRVLLLAAALLALLRTAPAEAQIVLDQWGTFASTLSSDCADFCDPETDLGWLLGLTFGPQNGGAEAGLIDSTWSDARGDAFAESSLEAGGGPRLRVNADSAAGGWVDGTASAVEGYTYTGLVADTLDITVRLTGTIGNPDADPATGLAARVGYVGNANVSSVLFDNAVAGLLTPDDAVELEQTASGAVDISQLLSVPVAPGDQFYLVASSAASAGGLDAFAESLGTLTIQFDPADEPNLQAASTPATAAVPALPRALVFGLGLAIALLGLTAARPPRT